MNKNYTTDDLVKIKQLLSSDIDSVKVGLAIAKSLNISDEVLIGLFTEDDITPTYRSDICERVWELRAFGNAWASMIASENTFGYYNGWVKEILNKLKEELNGK